MRNLDTDLLRTFLAINDAGSFLGGAARIHRSQSAASVQIKKLEALLGSAVFERHGRETLKGILQNGIYLGTGVTMPPWQNGYFYPTSPGDNGPAVYEDAALDAIIDHLEELQPDTLPPDAAQYNTPGVGEDEAGGGAADAGGEGEA